MTEVSPENRQKIIAQAINEIAFARNYKQGKVGYWKINEDLYYGRKTIVAEYSRANVDLGQMQAFVHTILSKIDTPLVFKFVKRKLSQLKRVLRLNSLRAYDASRDEWDIKDIVGKKQCVIYGRAIYAYYADSINGYEPHLENVDVYDFLIDPAAGGIDVERARYLGDYGVVLDRQQIQRGIDNGYYLKDEATQLLAGGGTATDINQEEVNKQNRTADQNVWLVTKEISDADKFKFWRWGTTFEGKRYFLLLSPNAGTAIEVCPIEEKFESALWWYWTYAAFPDLTEFWTPSFCDYVRDPIMAKAISINQMLDNSEQINKPQKIVNVGAIEKLSQLKYRRDGNIYVKKDIDVNKAIQFVKTPAIDSPLKVFDKLEMITDKASGVSAGDYGAAPNNSGSKATIYAGNQEASANRFGYFNKSYSFGYKRFAKLYEWGVREHLMRKIAIDIMGPDGIELEEIGRKDVFWKSDQFGVMVEASNAELALSEQQQKLKLSFLSAHSQDPTQNKKKAYETEAGIVGFTEEETRQLMDTSEFGDASLMAEAERDIELLLDGKKVPANPAANTAYKQRFVDYMTKNSENMETADWKRFTAYVKGLDKIIARNMVRMANEMLLKQTMAIGTAPADPNAPVPDPLAGGGAPAQPLPTEPLTP